MTTSNCGKEHDDEEIEQDYYGARYLNGTTRRFNSVDPKEDKYPGWSPYVYTLANPIRLVDPDGEGAMDFAAGFVDAFVNNVTVGAYQRMAPESMPQSVRGEILAGQFAGDAAAIRMGLTMATGGGTGTAVLLATSGGPQAPVTLSAAAVSAGVSAVGATIGVHAAKEMAATTLKMAAESGAAGKGTGNSGEQHHLLPKQFKSKFETAGLNIDDHVIYIDKGAHRLKPDGLHTGSEHWNSQWGKFFEANPNASRADILDQMNKMKAESGIK